MMSDSMRDVFKRVQGAGLLEQLSDGIDMAVAYQESARINAALWERTIEGRRTEVIDHVVSDIGVIEAASDRVERRSARTPEQLRKRGVKAAAPWLSCCGQGCVRCSDTKPEGD